MTPEERAEEIAAKYRDDPTGADLGLWEPPYLITDAIRAAVAEEREACAEIAKTYCDSAIGEAAVNRAHQRGETVTGCWAAFQEGLNCDAPEDIAALIRKRG